ncbi:MAG: DUF29 family protein [Gammaproteobacteria bacterium]|nr:DUF29 family protein [Gammaproteobacteria bacterium]
MTDLTDLYHSDYDAWLKDNRELLRQSRFEQRDVEHLISVKTPSLHPVRIHRSKCWTGPSCPTEEQHPHDAALRARNGPDRSGRNPGGQRAGLGPQRGRDDGRAGPPTPWRGGGAQLGGQRRRAAGEARADGQPGRRARRRRFRPRLPSLSPALCGP